MYVRRHTPGTVEQTLAQCLLGGGPSSFGKYEIYHTLADICNWRRQRHTWQVGGGHALGLLPLEFACLPPSLPPHPLKRTYSCQSYSYFWRDSVFFHSLSFFVPFFGIFFTCVAINFLLRRVANWRRRVIYAPAVDAVKPLAAGRWDILARCSRVGESQKSMIESYLMWILKDLSRFPYRISFL